MMKQRKRPINLFVPIIVLLVITLTSMEYISGNREHEICPADSCPAEEIIPVVLPSDTVISRLSFVVDSLNRIMDDSNTLAGFYAGLDSLLNGKDTLITIVHLGDSHIQAGYLGGPFMRLMHEQYGNPGRGWIAPFKLSRTNEPDDYFIHSSVKEWIAGRCVQSTYKCPIGPGGIGVQTDARSIRFDIGVTPNNGAGYGFNRAILFRGDRAMAMEPAGHLADSIRLAGTIFSSVPDLTTDTLFINRLVDTLQLKSSYRIPGTEMELPASDFTNVYYGMVLTNGNPGVLYHSIGVNGAMFVNYLDHQLMCQLELLKPTVLIVSLGTNETFGRRFNDDEFRSQIEEFIGMVHHWLPETTLLFTTPPECYKRVTVNGKRTYARNEQTSRAARVIVDVARQHGLAYWDMFRATGGIDSSGHWFKGKWMAADRIHFNKEGYREQGVLLFKALHNNRDEKKEESEQIIL